tara:strand:+ start:208 stop:453 length:246 start_codon:yes stop_codon:yes gene_type:complete
MSVGKTVYNISDVDKLSFGIVVSEKMRDDGWKWYRISWSNSVPSNAYSKPNLDPESGWFRCDTIKFFKKNIMISQINAIAS